MRVSLERFSSTAIGIRRAVEGSSPVVGALAFWRYIEAKVKAATAASKIAEAANLKAEAAVANMHLLAVQFADYKTHVAETYVSKSGLREFRDEVMTAVRELKGSVSGLHERMDQFSLAERGKQP